MKRAQSMIMSSTFYGGSSMLQTTALWQVGGAAVEGVRHLFHADPRTLSSAAGVVTALDDRGINPEGFSLLTYAAVRVCERPQPERYMRRPQHIP